MTHVAPRARNTEHPYDLIAEISKHSRVDRESWPRESQVQVTDVR
jgi:hypothetical protein